jgi:hypothetical protein
MKGTKVYVYKETGEFFDEFDSFRQAEETLGLYRNLIYEYLRGLRKYPVKGFVFSKHKAEIFPGEILKKREVVKPKNNQKIIIPETNGNIQFLSEADLRKKHDMFFILKSELNILQKGQFIEETKLIRKIGLWGKPGFRTVIDAPEVKLYKGKADGVIYFGHPESINKLKNEGVLS